MNFAMLLDMAADAFGERIAVTCGESGLTYVAPHARRRASLPAGASPTRRSWIPTDWRRP
jgi:hypothetical protein